MLRFLRLWLLLTLGWCLGWGAVAVFGLGRLELGFELLAQLVVVPPLQAAVLGWASGWLDPTRLAPELRRASSSRGVLGIWAATAAVLLYWGVAGDWAVASRASGGLTVAAGGLIAAWSFGRERSPGERLGALVGALVVVAGGLAALSPPSVETLRELLPGWGSGWRNLVVTEALLALGLAAVSWMRLREQTRRPSAAACFALALGAGVALGVVFLLNGLYYAKPSPPFRGWIGLLALFGSASLLCGAWLGVGGGSDPSRREDGLDAGASQGQ